ncbi:class I SAM-dependent methyltransferase [Actinomadura rubrisoli]|uniref:class I SAM-dependent methyltransferase n=1 Tax=Actinomadura rubrisoli TaxID=2530368 RepID=UPI0014051CA7|nr:class I SAM-dependent methyltransferase [Actinomadura rubrisoli]
MSTLDFHRDRERAPHLEQPAHHDRLHRAAEHVRGLRPTSVVDLGCGDGGLLSLIRDIPSWGYDWQPSNAAGWAARDVTAETRDVFESRDAPRWGECAVATEVLEHLADPHGTVAWIAAHARYIVASSPAFETGDSASECHAWAWDVDGYADLISPSFTILSHEVVGWTQLLVGEARR